MTAFLATRRLTSVLAARIWIAVSYALLPVATGAVAAGRIGTVVAFVLLPLIGTMVGRVLTGAPRAARRAAWAAGLLTAITAAFVPLAWPVAVIAAVAAAAAWSWLGPRTVINAAIIAALPAVILIPWTLHLVTSPSAFLAEAGLVPPGLAAAALRPESLLLLSPGGPGLPPAWVTAGLVLPAFGALLVRRRTALVYAGWGVALVGLVLALVVSRARITPPQGGAAVSAWPGLAIAIAAAGLLLAATPLIETVGRTVGGAGRSARRLGIDWRFLATLAVLAAAVSAPALAAGYWLADGLGGPVAAAAPPILPAFVAASSTGPDRPRTLVLRQEGGALSYAVLRAADPVPGEPELAETASSMHALESVVSSLTAAGGGDAGDTGQALSQFDIGYVLLPAPIDQALALQLNAAAGLQPLTRAASYDLWQVSGTVARVRVLVPGGTAVAVPSGPIGVTAAVAPGTSGTLVLAEAAGGWSATLGGRPLTPLAAPVDGWAQGFVLPPGGGRLVITRDETARNLSLGGEAAALLAAFVLALPGSRSSVAVPAAAEAVPDGEALPAAGRRRERAEGARSARRKRRPQVAMAGVAAGGAARAGDGDDIRAGYGASAGAAGSPFGPHPDPEYGAAFGTDPGFGADAAFGTDPSFGADLAFGTDPGFGAEAGSGAEPGYPPRPGRRAPVGASRTSAYGAEPALGATPQLEEEPEPWAGLMPGTPAAGPAGQPDPPSAPAAGRRLRRHGAGAAASTRRGTASRRGAGGPAPGTATPHEGRPPGARRGGPGGARRHRRRRAA